MSKVIGTGETVTDIIIRDDKPERMVCGGSCYNSMISLGRAGVKSVFIGEVGDDRLGRRTMEFLRDNGVSPDFLTVTAGKQSQLSLAFLNRKNDAEYVFYKDHASDIFPTHLPQVNREDVLLFGSFYAINPVIRRPLEDFVRRARQGGASIYYDINFRAAHTRDKDRVMPFILQNIEDADIVRGSDEDLLIVFGVKTPEEAWRLLADRCNILIVTRGAKGVSVFTHSGRRDYEVKPVRVVSTVGAGDSFNAGFVFGLIRSGIKRTGAATAKLELAPTSIDTFVDTAMRFSAEVCASTDNYISVATGDNLKSQNNINPQ